MTKRIGACDALLFAVNEYAGVPYRSGVNRTRYDKADVGVFMGREISNEWGYLFRNNYKGEILLWAYDSDEYDPFFWAIENGAGGIDQFWESEIKPDSLIENTVSPIHTVYPYDQIPSGGSSLRAYLPSVSELVTEEAVVLAASLPAWITNTKYSEVVNTKQLLNALFVDKQTARNMKVMPDITRLSQTLLDSSLYTAYNLLWLRSASQILYDHRAETFIQLVRTMSIDSDGFLTF